MKSEGECLLQSLLTRPVGFPLPLLVDVGNLRLLGDVIVVGVVSLRTRVRFHLTLQVTWRWRNTLKLNFKNSLVSEDTSDLGFRFSFRFRFSCEGGQCMTCSRVLRALERQTWVCDLWPLLWSCSVGGSGSDGVCRTDTLFWLMILSFSLGLHLQTGNSWLVWWLWWGNTCSSVQ